MHDLRGRQAAFNAASRGQWDGFAGHRSRVGALLGGDEGPGGTRLCVLGAGNGNDLDLPALLGRHREVHLVDLDAEALDGAAGRQGVSGHPGLRLHGGIDLTAMLDAISSWSPGSEVGPGDLEALATWPAARVGLVLPGPFDRVASTCLISQLIDTAFHALGVEHPRAGQAVGAVRAGHLRLMARLADGGGPATLITDVASSERFPALATAPGHALPSLLPRLAREGSHLHGLHPAELVAALRGDRDLGPRLTGLDSARPWSWRLHSRTYLVWAMTFRVGPARPR